MLHKAAIGIVQTPEDQLMIYFFKRWILESGNQEVEVLIENLKSKGNKVLNINTKSKPKTLEKELFLFISLYFMVFKLDSLYFIFL